LQSADFTLYTPQNRVQISRFPTYAMFQRANHLR